MAPSCPPNTLTVQISGHPETYVLGFSEQKQLIMGIPRLLQAYKFCQEKKNDSEGKEYSLFMVKNNINNFLSNILIH